MFFRATGLRDCFNLNCGIFNKVIGMKDTLSVHIFTVENRCQEAGFVIMKLVLLEQPTNFSKRLSEEHYNTPTLAHKITSHYIASCLLIIEVTECPQGAQRGEY